MAIDYLVGEGVKTCHLSYLCSFASDKYNIALVVCLILNSLGISTSILYTAEERGAQAGVLPSRRRVVAVQGRATTPLTRYCAGKAYPPTPHPHKALPRKGTAPFHRQTPLLIPEFYPTLQRLSHHSGG